MSKPNSKWFRGGDDDESDDSQRSSGEESEEDEEEERSQSGEESDEEDEEEESEEEKKQEEKNEARKRFLKGREESSDEDSGDEKKKTSGRVKRKQEMVDCIKQIRAKLTKDDCAAASDLLDKIRLLGLKAIKMEGWSVPPRAYFRAILIVEAYAKQFDDEDKRSELKEKQHDLRELRQKAKKFGSAFAAVLEKQRGIYGDDFDWQDELDDEDDEEEEEPEEEEILPRLPHKDSDKEKEKEKIWDPEFAEKKLMEVLSMRGKKGTDKEEQVRELQRIFNHVLVTEMPLRVKILFHLLAAYLDMHSPQSNYLPRDPWHNAYSTLTRMLELLNDNQHVILLRDGEAEEGLEENPANINDGKQPDVKIPVAGGFVGYVQRLDDEFIKALQFIDPHSQEYVTRLQDEAFLLDALERTLQYYSMRNMNKHAARIASRIVDHLYYRRQDDHVKMLAKQRVITEKAKKKSQDAAQADWEAVHGQGKDGPQSPKEEPKTPADGQEGKGKRGQRERIERRRKEYALTEDVSDCMQRLWPLIQKYNDEKAKIRALLANVYHLALNNKYTQARDQLLASHVGDHINSTSVQPAFAIAYNRALAQLGLAAFRLGLFKDVHVCLNELCATQKMKELLAQGLPAQRYNEPRKPEQERQDKMRLCPYHMHINLEMLEAAHLVSAMLVEVPTLAANPHSKPKIQSKAFNKLLNHYQAQVFLGPPENVRDHVYAAHRALLDGEWKTCSDLVCAIPAWDLVHGGAAIKAMLTRRIKEEALRSYLMQFAQLYDSIGLDVLATKFEMAPNLVHAVVSKMMFNSELPGSWNQPAACIQIHHGAPNKLQFLALQTAEKAQALVDYNEKMVEFKTGGAMGFGQYSKDGKQGNRSSEWGGTNRWPFGGQRRVQIAGRGTYQAKRQQGSGQTNSGQRGNNPFQFRSRNQGQQRQGTFSSGAGRSATYAQAGQRMGTQ